MVEVVFVPVAWVQVSPVTPRDPMVAFVRKALVAKRLVVVVFVLVTFPRYAFQRLVEMPRE